MSFCNQCGTSNADDARFCKSCGSPVVAGQAPGQAVPPPPQPPQAPTESPRDIGERFGRRLGEAGETFGREMSRAGERLGKEFEHVGKEWEAWVDWRFGVIWPLVSSLIGAIVLIIVIALVQTAGYTNASDFLTTYFLLFFVLMVIAGYLSYLSRKYRRAMKWVQPISLAAGIAIAMWILSEINFALSRDTGIAGLETAGSLFRVLAFVAAVVIVVLGYVFLFFVTPEVRATLSTGDVKRQ